MSKNNCPKKIIKFGLTNGEAKVNLTTGSAKISGTDIDFAGSSTCNSIDNDFKEWKKRKCGYETDSNIDSISSIGSCLSTASDDLNEGPNRSNKVISAAINFTENVVTDIARNVIVSSISGLFL